MVGVGRTGVVVADLTGVVGADLTEVDAVDEGCECKAAAALLDLAI